jgi:hypothetical protein
MSSAFNHNAGLSTENAYHSVLSPANKNLCSAISLNDTQPNELHLQIYNLSLCALFTFAYGVLQKKIIGQTILQVKHRAPLEVLYCYELRIPYQFRHQQARFMQQDLAKLFPQYEAHLATQAVLNTHALKSSFITEQTAVLIITQTSVC